MEDKIRVLIVDDHPVVRKGLKMLLNNALNIEVVGEAIDGLEAIHQAHELNPDIILMDLLMPRMDGIAATIDIKRDNPAARILILSSFSEDDKVFPAIKAGASGYLLKDSMPEELVQAIHNIYNGRPSLHPVIASKLMEEFNKQEESGSQQELLTDREVEVLKLIANGFSNQEIASKLVISERTVSTHISNILDKLHLANRTQAALYALRQGLVSLYQTGQKYPQ